LKAPKVANDRGVSIFCSGKCYDLYSAEEPEYNNFNRYNNNIDDSVAGDVVNTNEQYLNLLIESKAEYKCDTLIEEEINRVIISDRPVYQIEKREFFAKLNRIVEDREKRQKEVDAVATYAAGAATNDTTVDADIAYIMGLEDTPQEAMKDLTMINLAKAQKEVDDDFNIVFTDDAGDGANAGGAVDSAESLASTLADIATNDKDEIAKNMIKSATKKIDNSRNNIFVDENEDVLMLAEDSEKLKIEDTKSDFDRYRFSYYGNNAQPLNHNNSEYNHLFNGESLRDRLLSRRRRNNNPFHTNLYNRQDDNDSDNDNDNDSDNDDNKNNNIDSNSDSDNSDSDNDTNTKKYLKKEPSLKSLTKKVQTSNLQINAVHSALMRLNTTVKESGKYIESDLTTIKEATTKSSDDTIIIVDRLDLLFGKLEELQKQQDFMQVTINKLVIKQSQ